MPECLNCGNRESFEKKTVVSYPVEYDPDSGDIVWESDDYEFGYSLSTGCPTCGEDVTVEQELVCAECQSDDVDQTT